MFDDNFNDNFNDNPRDPGYGSEYPMEKKDNTELDALLKKEMIDLIVDRIKTNKGYANFLRKSHGLYEQTIKFLSGAIESCEEIENYEDCKFLLNFKKEIEANAAQTS